MGESTEQPASRRERLSTDDAAGLRAYAAQRRDQADRLAVVLEEIAANGLPTPEDCTPWAEVRERQLARLAAQRGHVA